MAVFKVDKITGKVLERYGSAVDAAEANGLTRYGMYSHLRDCVLSPSREVYRYERDYNPREEFGSKKHKPILCVEATSGRRVAVFDSVAQAAHALYLTNSAIVQACMHGRRTACGRYKLMYLGRMGEVS